MAKRFVVERVTETGGRVCPPTIVGIGGTADLCRKLAKIAATRRLGSGCDDQEGAAQERELSAAVNGLGIGPLLVAMDAHGAGLYDDMHKASTERMEAYGANEGAWFSGMYKLWKRYLPDSAKNRSMVFWYNLISRFDTGDDLLFLNHGYAAQDGDPNTVDLDPGDEKNRYSIQLYHRLIGSTEWHGRQALEVSSGRGGGADWVMRAFGPGSLVGLDIAKASTEFCRRHYTDPRLSFETGDAQAMPFSDGSFDIVFNVESSLNYPDFDAYLREVDRVLRPGGRFLIADYRREKRLKRFEAALRATGYEVVQIENISDQIIRGLELSESRKVAVIEKYSPRLLRNTIKRFARISNADDSEYELFSSGKKGYLIAVLEKPS